MPTVKIGIAVQSLGRAVRAALEVASQCQAEGVELDLRTGLPPADLTPSAVRQFRKLLDDLRLTAPVAAFPTRRGFGEPEQLERRISAAAVAIKAASQLGAKRLVLNVGSIGEEASPERTLLVDSLTLLAQQGDHYGVRLALILPAEELPQATQLFAELPAHAVGACLDPAELLAAGQDPAEAAQHLGSPPAHLYASDAVRGLGGSAVTPVQLGRGSVDWPELLAALEEHGYHDWAMLRLRPGGELAELADGVAFLRTVGS